MGQNHASLQNKRRCGLGSANCGRAPRRLLSPAVAPVIPTRGQAWVAGPHSRGTRDAPRGAFDCEPGRALRLLRRPRPPAPGGAPPSIGHSARWPRLLFDFTARRRGRRPSSVRSHSLRRSRLRAEEGSSPGIDRNLWGGDEGLDDLEGLRPGSGPCLRNTAVSHGASEGRRFLKLCEPQSVRL